MNTKKLLTKVIKKEIIKSIDKAKISNVRIYEKDVDFKIDFVIDNNCLIETLKTIQSEGEA